MIVRYATPRDWIAYDAPSILAALVEAKAAMLALADIPYQRSWADELLQLQLKREVAGTSRIEGAEFTERELDAALRDYPDVLAHPLFSEPVSVDLNNADLRNVLRLIAHKTGLEIRLDPEVHGVVTIREKNPLGVVIDKLMRSNKLSCVIEPGNVIRIGPMLQTRSQRQAAAAVATYRWIAALPADRPLDESLILDVHRRLVAGCDDDHCPPGRLRERDQNVSFGSPRHRGVEGGAPCAAALRALCKAAGSSFQSHDPLVQALAIHYHFAAMHPFLDGNGRTARALEAIMLGRVGLRDTLFIAMSNYYYEEKAGYLSALAAARAADHDLTPFLNFALRGIAIQCRRLFGEIRRQIAKALYRNTVADLFGRLKSPRKRVMSARHVQVLNLLLDEGDMSLATFERRSRHLYAGVKNARKAMMRDLDYLVGLGAILATPTVEQTGEGSFLLVIDLGWPTRITETEFFRLAMELPKGKVHGFLSS